MAEPQLLAVLIVIAVFLATFAVATYLVWRVMNRPGNYIGSRMERWEAAEAQRREDEQHRSAQEARPADGAADGAGASGNPGGTDGFEGTDSHRERDEDD